MRWTSLLLPFSLLGAGVLAAKSDPANTFQNFHQKALSSTPIKLDDVSYKKVTGLPRDYTVAVLLTALDSRYACQMCRDFDPEWKLLSKSWTKGDKAGDSRTLFTTLDFNDGRETFLSLGLQTAPVLMLFQPSTGEFAVANTDPVRFDFTTGAPSAESVRNWVARYLPGRPVPEVNRPTNWFGIIISLTTVAGIITTLVTAWPYIGPIIQHRRLWQFISLVTVLGCTCGTMFNIIRNTPYAGHDGKGHISFFAGGFQTQFQIESQIIGALYGVLAFCAICLADKAPRVKGPKTQQSIVIAFSVLMLVLYSFLLSIFRIKNGGYPFALPPFL
ncbi:OST3/OST6 family protein [Diaporthe helianthi]|uniref:OST3/OST6 family protein n=1 Tax=Diaporthe helianthi TaxID=158607 RepID=A0A2P5I3B1_DIAHE|nr:OST3/OST6 family protein [Diaporthe helianthi]